MSKKSLCFKWDEIGDAYQAFSAMSDEGDWQSIITQVATIIAKNATGPRSILDYGAGLGSTAASIRRQLYGTHGLLSSWFLYEPDSFARVAHPIMIPPVGKYMPVNSYPQLPKNTMVDIVLFIHTSYYISEFDKELEKSFASYLSENNGYALCISMPENSPFYIPELKNSIPWHAEEIIQAALAQGMKCETIKLRSRFRWLTMLEADSDLSRAIASFVCGGREVSPSEVKIVEKHLAGEVDFGDWLIVIKG